MKRGDLLYLTGSMWVGLGIAAGRWWLTLGGCVAYLASGWSYDHDRKGSYQ